MTFRPLLAVALSLALLAPAHDAFAATKQKPAKVTVSKKYVWRGYGFLPGYPRNERERLRDSRQRPEWRYYNWYGQPQYGFGQPGFYRGQYNGGSFGPCWISTPIGMMPTCGGR